MRWTAPFRFPNIRQTIDHYHLYDRTLMMLLTKMAGAGSPCTYWKNTALTIYGTLNEDLTKCYCWKKTDDEDTAGIKAQPDRDHALCMGTGMLQGYQKYGYYELVFSTPSTYTTSSNAIQIGRDANGEPDHFLLSSATTITESIETENYILNNFKAVDYFIAKDRSDKNVNRIEYFYSIDDGVNWIQLTMIDYTINKFGNKQASNFVLNEGISQIKFKITLKKRYNTSPSPLINSIRFRYRNHLSLVEIDPRFNVNIPSFLSCRDAPKEMIIQSEHGFKTTKPMMWWVLPGINIQETDIIMFLQGEFKNEKYEVENLTKHVYGPETKVLHTSFETMFLRDNYSIIRILDLLI